MSISVSESKDGCVILSVPGRFDYEVHREFRNAYDGKDPTTIFILDLAQTEYIDSSALGMILLLREYVNGNNANIRIIHCRDEIKKVFDVTNINKLIDIT